MSKTPTLLEASNEPQVEVEPQIRTHQRWRAVFSFPVVLGMLLVVLTVLTVRSRFNDPDMWWHLKTGEIIWNTHSIPRVDVFSFTVNDHPWTAQEWLSELTIYTAWKLGGNTGLMLWLCFFASLLMIGAYTLCALYSGNVKVAFLGALATWLFSTVGLSIRPQLIGYLLLICELLILHLGRSRGSRWFLALPPLFAIWVNCHSSFFFGLIVLAVVLMCSFLDVHVGSLVSHRWETQRRNTLLAASVLSILALLLNPIGIKQVIYPLDVMLNQHVGVANVSEWQQPNFQDGRSLALLGVAGLILLVPLLRRLELRLDELLLLGLGFGLAVQHERMLFVFGILAAPILCRLLASAWDNYEAQKDRGLPNAILIALSLLVIRLAFPNPHELQVQVQQHNPVKAIEFIRQSGISGRMLNEYVYGGYLIWAAPEHKVFVDGRSDVFEWAGVLKDYHTWSTLQADPNGLLAKYNIDFCLLSQRAAICKVLPLLPQWKMVYSDELSKVFVRQK